MRNKHNKTYESHPNTSRLIKETDNSEQNQDNNSEQNQEQNQEKPASNFPKKVEKSVHLTTIRDDVQQVMSKKNSFQGWSRSVRRVRN